MDLHGRSVRKPGSVICSKWRIDAMLRSNDTSATYVATHRNGAQVALKILHSHLSSDRTLQARFRREAYVANSIPHPDTVKVIDDDETDDGCAVLVMDHFDGETLEERRNRAGGTLPLDEVLSTMDNLLDIVATAHDQGIVHRDLKPETVFVTTDGRVKVLDFGTARLLSEAVPPQEMTAAGMVVGSPTYMAPEQARGQRDHVDAQSDIFSLGAMMFVLLSGESVHTFENPIAALVAAAKARARSLRVVTGPEISDEVVEVVDRALAFKKADRWPDARAFRAALRASRGELIDTFPQPGRLDPIVGLGDTSEQPVLFGSPSSRSGAYRALSLPPSGRHQVEPAAGPGSHLPSGWAPPSAPHLAAPRSSPSTPGMPALRSGAPAHPTPRKSQPETERGARTSRFEDDEAEDAPTLSFNIEQMHPGLTAALAEARRAGPQGDGRSSAPQRIPSAPVLQKVQAPPPPHPAPSNPMKATQPSPFSALEPPSTRAPSGAVRRPSVSGMPSASSPGMPARPSPAAPPRPGRSTLSLRAVEPPAAAPRPAPAAVPRPAPPAPAAPSPASVTPTAPTEPHANVMPALPRPGLPSQVGGVDPRRSTLVIPGSPALPSRREREPPQQVFQAEVMGSGRSLASSKSKIPSLTPSNAATRMDMHAGLAAAAIVPAAAAVVPTAPPLAAMRVPGPGPTAMMGFHGQPPPSRPPAPFAVMVQVPPPPPVTRPPEKLPEGYLGKKLSTHEELRILVPEASLSMDYNAIIADASRRKRRITVVVVVLVLAIVAAAIGVTLGSR